MYNICGDLHRGFIKCIIRKWTLTSSSQLIKVILLLMKFRGLSRILTLELIPSFHLEINSDTRKKFNNKFLILFCSSAIRYEEKSYVKPTQLKHNELSTLYTYH